MFCGNNVYWLSHTRLGTLGCCPPPPFSPPPPSSHLHIYTSLKLTCCLSSTRGSPGTFKVNCCSDMLRIFCNNISVQQRVMGHVDAPGRLVRVDGNHHCSWKPGPVNKTWTTQIPSSVLWATDIYLSFFRLVHLSLWQPFFCGKSF